MVTDALDLNSLPAFIPGSLTMMKIASLERLGFTVVGFVCLCVVGRSWWFSVSLAVRSC